MDIKDAERNFSILQNHSNSEYLDIGLTGKIVVRTNWLGKAWKDMWNWRGGVDKDVLFKANETFQTLKINDDVSLSILSSLGDRVYLKDPSFSLQTQRVHNAGVEILTQNQKNAPSIQKKDDRENGTDQPQKSDMTLEKYEALITSSDTQNIEENIQKAQDALDPDSPDLEYSKKSLQHIKSPKDTKQAKFGLKLKSELKEESPSVEAPLNSLPIRQRQKPENTQLAKEEKETPVKQEITLDEFRKIYSDIKIDFYAKAKSGGNQEDLENIQKRLEDVERILKSSAELSDFKGIFEDDVNKLKESIKQTREKQTELKKEKELEIEKAKKEDKVTTVKQEVTFEEFRTIYNDIKTDFYAKAKSGGNQEVLQDIQKRLEAAEKTLSNIVESSGLKEVFKSDINKLKENIKQMREKQTGLENVKSGPEVIAPVKQNTMYSEFSDMYRQIRKDFINTNYLSGEEQIKVLERLKKEIDFAENALNNPELLKHKKDYQEDINKIKADIKRMINQNIKSQQSKDSLNADIHKMTKSYTEKLEKARQEEKGLLEETVTKLKNLIANSQKMINDPTTNAQDKEKFKNQISAFELQIKKIKEQLGQ